MGQHNSVSAFLWVNRLHAAQSSGYYNRKLFASLVCTIEQWKVWIRLLFPCFTVTENHEGFQWQSEEYKDIVHIWIIVNKVTSAAPMQKRLELSEKKCVRVGVVCFCQCYASRWLQYTPFNVNSVKLNMGTSVEFGDICKVWRHLHSFLQKETQRKFINTNHLSHARCLRQVPVRIQG